MAQKVRKRWRSPEQIEQMPRAEKLAYREYTRQFRQNALRELTTNLTLTNDQKLDLLIDYTVGVPLE